jgi:hypothetical protein
MTGIWQPPKLFVVDADNAPGATGLLVVAGEKQTVPMPSLLEIPIQYAAVGTAHRGPGRGVFALLFVAEAVPA